MQTMAVTQSKNTQYFSVGYSVTFIPFDALSSLAGKEHREFRLVACSPVVLHSAVTASEMKLQQLTSAHTYDPLAFISNFLLYESFYQRTVHFIMPSIQLHSPWSGVNEGLQKILQKLSSSVRVSNKFYFSSL